MMKLLVILQQRAIALPVDTRDKVSFLIRKIEEMVIFYSFDHKSANILNKKLLAQHGVDSHIARLTVKLMLQP